MSAYEVIGWGGMALAVGAWLWCVVLYVRYEVDMWRIDHE